MNWLSWRKELKSKVQNVTEDTYDALVIDIWSYQMAHNELYRSFVHLLKGVDFKAEQLNDIPFLPISFFKSHRVVTGDLDSQALFKSSGTTGQTRSRHFVNDTGFYLRHAERIFENQYQSLEDFIIVALLPGYQERNDSSLIYMVKHFIEKSNNSLSDFYLNREEELVGLLNNPPIDKKILLIGVSFALMDLVENFSLQLDDKSIIFMETGGMKGNREELTKEALHAFFRNRTGLAHIHSEYGMTELLSQAYGHDKMFYSNLFLNPIITDRLDPLCILSNGQAGVINLIDLANIDSCAFIATEDMGVKHSDKVFELLGRMDYAEIRGCNLLVSDIR